MLNRLCTICVRGGSKGVKGKNLRLLHGKPLLAYSIEQAKASGLFSAIAVSSDSDELLGVAKKWDADFLIKRPSELANDTAPKVPAIQHCVKTVEERLGLTFSVCVDLDVTSPLRSFRDICGAVELLEERGVSNVITGAPARRSPYFNLVELDGQGVVHLCKPLTKMIVRRQDAPKCYDMNASIYVWKRDALFAGGSIFNPDTLLYVMPEERSIDIDTELDFTIVRLLMKEQHEDV